MQPEVLENPWERLSALIKTEQPEKIVAFLESINPADTSLAVSRLTDDEQRKLFQLIHPEDAAEVFEDFSDALTIDVIGELEPEQVASIFEELDSDHVADLLGGLDEDDANSIIDQMNPEDAEEARSLLQYAPDTAGGLMISEFLDYRSNQTIQDVLDDLQTNREKYADYDVQYLYVTDEQKRLQGVLRMRDLLFPERETKLGKVMIAKPFKVHVEDSLNELRNFFEEHNLFGVPVVDAESCLQGVVLPEAVEEAKRKRSVHQFLGLSGIIGGEEFRSMPLLVRSGRRLSWLSLNIVLNIIAASVIAMYQDTLAAAIALAVFLPMVSDMSGCSGNQAVAVSMRELSWDWYDLSNFVGFDQRGRGWDYKWYFSWLPPWSSGIYLERKCFPRTGGWWSNGVEYNRCCFAGRHDPPDFEAHETRSCIGFKPIAHHSY
jgi:magnesium transporter